MKLSRTAMLGVVVGASLVLAASVEAQRGTGGRGAGGGAAQLPQLIDLAIEHEDEVGLSLQTVESLGELKTEVDEVFEPFRADIAEFRRQMQRGGGSGGFQQMREIMQRVGEALAPYKERYDMLLTDQQRAAVRAYLPRRGGRGGNR